jgi:hypothetical protein
LRTVCTPPGQWAILSTLETAQASGVDEEMILRPEAEGSVPGRTN